MYTHLKRWWFPTTLSLATLIAILSLWPLATLPEVPGTDKLHHFIAYASLIFPSAFFTRSWWWHGVLMLVFSGVIELLQPLVNRYCDIYDLLANGCGLLCGIILAFIARFFLQRFSTFSTSKI